MNSEQEIYSDARLLALLVRRFPTETEPEISLENPGCLFAVVVFGLGIDAQQAQFLGAFQRNQC